MGDDYDYFVVTGPVGHEGGDTYELPSAEEIAEKYFDTDAEVVVPETPDVWSEYDGQQAYE